MFHGLTFFFESLLAMAVSLIALRNMQRDRRIKRVLRGTRTTAIAEVREGQTVKIVGEVVAGTGTLTAPLSGRTCVYFRVHAEEYAPRTGRLGAWQQVASEERGVDFYVRDASGVALVHFTGGSVWAALERDRAARSSPILYSDAALERFLADRGRSVEGLLFRKNLRAYEGVLAAGERVAVGGLARWLPDPDAAGGSYRETPKRLVLQASEALPLFLSDDESAR